MASAVCVGMVLGACLNGGPTGNTPAERCNLPDDYDVLQVPPDPCLQRDFEFGKTFIAAVDATNVAKGPCHSATFEVEGDNGTDRVYRDTDSLAITIAYRAPGCTHASLTFGGFHVNGSPWARYYCRPDGCNFGGVGSNIRAGRRSIDQPSGSVTFTGENGSFPPIDLASPPNLEGFQVCAIIVGFDDGQPDGSHTSDQLNLPSEACKQRP